MLPIPESIVHLNPHVQVSSRIGVARQLTNASACLPRATLYPPLPKASKSSRSSAVGAPSAVGAKRTDEIRMTSSSGLRTMPHYCAECEYEHGNEVTAEAIAAGQVSCPVCGSTRISARALAGVAEVVVSVPPARVVTHSHHHDGSESIVVGSEEFHSSSVAGREDHRQDFHGRPAQNEEDVLQVCRSLRAALRRQGEVWGRFSTPAAPTDDVDAVAEDDAGAVLRVQVTRVERVAWGSLALSGQTTLQRNAEELAADIRAAVESKLYPLPQRRELLLALDAIRSPAYVHDEVVAAFLATHGEWAAGLGYWAIWLVGPTADLTRRLC
jgi:hypothetical protein